MRVTRLLAPLAIVVAIMVSTACSRTPEGVLDREEMAQLLADIHEAEGLADQNYRTYQPDSARLKLRAAVYHKHGVDGPTVDTSLAWYGRNIEKYVEVYDRVLVILDERLAQANRSKAGRTSVADEVNFAVEGDSVVLWQPALPTLFAPNLGREFISRSLNSDRYWTKDDNFVLKFKAVGTSAPVAVQLTLHYNDGTYDIKSRTLRGEGWQTVTMAADTARRASDISVVLHYVPQQTDIIAAIDSLTLTRIHKKPL